MVLDANVTDASFWSYNGQPPDPTKMKQMVFVIESYFNDPSGTFYIDDIHFVDADDTPFDLGQHADDEFLDLVSQRTFLYFLDWYDPATGLFQDRSISPDLMSTASTGFGLTALAIGESRGWVDRPVAVQMITRTLQTLYDGQSATDTVTDTITDTNGYRGFYYHFLGTDGLRKDDGSELSPVDTAILLAGVLTVREHFDDVPEIVDLADQIYQRVEWDWMLDSSNDCFYLAWKPEYDPDDGYEIPAPDGGYFSKYHWDYYTDEVILINLLAIGSPTHPVSKDVFYAWTRDSDSYGGHSHIRSWNGSFFTYVFAHLWVDFSALGEDGHPSQPVDWWDNSIEATQANWQFAVDHQDDTSCDGDDDYTTYGEDSWGLTAADGPDGNYHAYGALPAAVSPEHDGTVAPYGAGMATMFLAEESIPALKHYFASTDLWRYRFGFGDAYNLDPPGCDGSWYSHGAFGIDQGPMLISLENYRSGFVWSTMRQNEYFCRAIYGIWGAPYVFINGPVSGIVGPMYTFTATVEPSIVTTPITYVWQAAGQGVIEHTGGLSDTVAFQWDNPGTFTIVATATNAAGTVTGTHTITVGHRVYLPLVCTAATHSTSVEPLDATTANGMVAVLSPIAISFWMPISLRTRRN